MADWLKAECLRDAAPALLAAAKQAIEDCVDLVGTDAGNALKAAIHQAEGTKECDQCGVTVPWMKLLCDRCYENTYGRGQP